MNELSALFGPDQVPEQRVLSSEGVHPIFCFTIRGIPSAYHGWHTIRLHAGCTKRKRRGRDPIALLWRGVNTSGSRDNRYGKCIVGLNLEPAACFRAIRKPPRNAPRLPIQTNNRATSEPHTHAMSNENKFPSKTGSSTPSPERAQEGTRSGSIYLTAGTAQSRRWNTAWTEQAS